MAINDELLALRVPSKLKEDLEHMYPDTSMRNNVIREAIQRIVDKKIIITKREIELKAAY